MRVNYSTFKDKKDFLALAEHFEVAEKSWPGIGYENRYKQWKQSHGKKKGKISKTHKEVLVIYINI